MLMNNVNVEENILQENLFYQNELVLSYTIKYPSFSSESFQICLEELNAYYKTKALLYESNNVMELYKMAVKEYEYSMENGFPVRQFEVYVEYQVTFNQNCIISLYFDQYEYTGGAHGSTLRYSDTWDLRRCKKVELSDFFPKGSNYREYVIALINEQIRSEIESGNNIYFEDYQQLVTEQFEEANFYLTKEGITIYFQQYDIAPYSSGILTFTIKRIPSIEN